MIQGAAGQLTIQTHLKQVCLSNADPQLVQIWFKAVLTRFLRSWTFEKILVGVVTINNWLDIQVLSHPSGTLKFNLLSREQL